MHLSKETKAYYESIGIWEHRLEALGLLANTIEKGNLINSEHMKETMNQLLIKMDYWYECYRREVEEEFQNIINEKSGYEKRAEQRVKDKWGRIDE